VKADVTRLLSQSEALSRKGEVSREEFDTARFAVCAWVDEAILSSPWTQRNLWQREQLQRIMYNTTEAGEEFFDRMNALGFHQREAREVYYLCLALGFMGRHCHAGDDFLLAQLKSSNLQVLLGSSAGIPSLDRAELFPEGYPAEAAAAAPAQPKSGFSLFTVLCIAAPVVLFGVLFLIYRFSLSGLGDNLLRTVPY
ncbi:MAG: type VI secretion system protein ImpK, partial [Deltaproteobacteria bacterium RIFOXYB2_FULL_66_7]